ncbi:peptidyl-tRNA hydrolase ICT1, mitochondrial [Acyrthosiphon pisum]|uniref:Large ribosomal subunit protein mL62 n=1 Tax=Acyrthosiphon pisum TaxID=7029 RepID=A0A8R2A5P8_ACYPI|nr:peptidyl-tRNA hydrolase ICT1, mitochondrial [Acyrthosiphon pisum]|eukprot:XP_001952371.1 PREDICTED: peptidyl-tRNA hydrolase ICT1, mitochondrial [Acyrthosiphon pisum]
MSFTVSKCFCNAVRTLSRSNYTSAISLKNLHPKSSLKITTPSPEQLADNKIFTGYIPVEELEITYSTSSGPGGQNVNKVNTKVDLRFKVESAQWLNEEIRQKLININQNKLTKEGYLVIRSEKTRSQQLNLADAIERLRSLVWKAAEPEPKQSEESIEKIRRRMEKANRTRLIEKKMKSLTKSNRQAPTVF